MKINNNFLKDKSAELSQAEKIELLSEDVQEIMGQVPNWIVRWGITVIFAVIILLLAGSFVFKYPDVITSSITIISENPSASIVARNSGKIENLLVQNSEKVKQNQVLAIIENSANSTHVFDLKEKLNTFSGFFNKPLSDLSMGFPDNYSLGPMQSAFSNFQRQLRDYHNFLKVDIIGKKIKSLRQQNRDYESYVEKLQQQALNHEKTLALTKRQFLRDSSLVSNNVIAAADYEKSGQAYLQAKNSYQGLLASVVNTQMQINQLNYQVIDLESQQVEKAQSFINTLKEAYDNLNATVQEWEKQFILASPIDGEITFNQYWSKNQNVSTGEVVFTVVPSKPQNIIGRIKLPVSGSGKVKTKQQVLIRLDNFPYTEFGMLEGKTESISLIPETTQQGVFYTVAVSLTNGLTTNYKKQLPFNQEMQGSAEIITEELSLFERLLNPIKSTLKKTL